ncbi:AMP-dependent synthetase and ligase [Umbelopsis sp. PMI_123]|nr:AMP-dependent synthetase and ligase [Umbelopsis sp. PMI_123]
MSVHRTTTSKIFTCQTVRTKLPPTAAVDYTPLNPVNFLLRSAQIYGHKIAIIYGGKRYTYIDFALRVKSFATALINHYNIKPGDRVAILCPNTPPLLEAHFGIPAAKAVITAINYRLNAQEVDYIVRHSEAKMFIIDAEYRHLIPSDLDIPIVLITEDNQDPYEEMLRLGEHGRWQDLELVTDEREVFGMSYTSGSTGKPKGVRHAYRGAYLSALNLSLRAQLSSETVYMWTLPMFHCNGWQFPWAVTAVSGTHIMLRKIDYDLIWHHLLYDGVTIYNGAPTLQTEIVNHPKARPLHRKVIVHTGGSSPSSVLLKELENLNIHARHIYGLTETFGPTAATYDQPQISHLPDEERYAMMARQGYTDIVSDEMCVMNPQTGEEVPMDGITIGEVTIRGNIVMKDYYKDPEATKKAFRNGVFWTGDLAVRHPDGAVEIKDRSKDIVISGGENISSIEIESIILHLEDVLEVAVVAGPDEKWGEHPVAFVVPKHGRVVTASKVTSFCKSQLAGFKLPKTVHIVTELPKTSTGKTQKFILREQLWKGKEKKIN